VLTAYRCSVALGSEHLSRSSVRYDLLQRLADSARRRDVAILAFGLGRDEVRVVLEGAPREREAVILGMKSGTARSLASAGAVILWDDTERIEATPAILPATVAWAHTVPGVDDPLATPWTSHRDLLGFRHARFFDAEGLRARVDPAEVHRLAGGGPLPRVRRNALGAQLDALLRVAAAVLGVSPGDRACNRLFVQLARAQGYPSGSIEDALLLGARRVRQLSQHQDPLLPVAEVHLSDQRLMQLP
jgi:hypothetical protein